MCDRIELPGGGFAIVCGGHRGRRKAACVHCGRPASLLCDGPGKNGKTCDRPICAACTTPGGKDIDYCRDHASQIRLAL